MGDFDDWTLGQKSRLEEEMWRREVLAEWGILNCIYIWFLPRKSGIKLSEITLMPENKTFASGRNVLIRHQRIAHKPCISAGAMPYIA
jgi:hypothetical protein